MVGRSSPDSLYAAQQANVVGRRSADRKTLQLIKVIGEVCFNVVAPVDLSADNYAKFFSVDYRSIVCLNVIAALKLDAQVVNCVYLTDKDKVSTHR